MILLIPRIYMYFTSGTLKYAIEVLYLRGIEPQKYVKNSIFELRSENCVNRRQREAVP